MLYTRGLIRRLLKIDFVRFCLVGTLGFIINFALLTLFYKGLHAPLFIAQILAAEVALFNNFLFHHHWTYKSHNVTKSLVHLLVQFHLSSWAAIIGSALIVSLCVQMLNLHYGVALIIASLLALMWNFGWTKFVIWKRHHEGDEAKQQAKIEEKK